MSTDLRVQFIQAPAGIRLATPVARRSGEDRPAHEQHREQSGKGAGGAGNEHAARARANAEKAALADPAAAEVVDVPADVVTEPEGADNGGSALSPVDGSASSDPGLSQTPPEPEMAHPQEVPPEWMHMQNRFLELIGELERQAEARSRDVVTELKNLTPAVLDLAVAIAGRIVNSGETGTADLTSMIDEALAKVLSGVDDGASIRVRAGVEVEEVARSVLGDRMGDPSRFQLVVDRTLPDRAVELQCDMRSVTVDANEALSRLADQLRAGGMDV